MSEAVSKDEKIRQRQAQLAKWKEKKSQSPSASTGNNNNDAEGILNIKSSSPEEQKRLERLKKLEEWKKKKLQSQDSSVSEEQALRQKKLEEWKKRRENGGAKGVPPPKKQSTSFKFTARPAQKPPSLKRKQLFDDDDEEETSVGKFKVPTLLKNKSEDQANKDEVDALDVFLEDLHEDEHGADIVSADIAQESLDEEEDDDEDRLRALQLKSLQTGKTLATVDHSQIDYIEFKKNFYVESLEVSMLSNEEVDQLRQKLGEIKVKGNNCPRPVWTWLQLGFSPTVNSVIENKLQFKEPTGIQSQALPVILSGRDMLAIAKTGSGKTLAFVLPLLRHVQDQPPLQEGDGPIAVLMSPTRELAQQIFKQLVTFTKKLGLSACCCYGGSSIEPQIAELKKGAQIVVCTPGRLIDLLATNNGRVCNLSRVTYVVLDEADRMFDFGFEPQIKKIFSQIRPDKQCVLFSATFARKMESLARDTLHDPVEVIVGGISVVAPEIKQHVELFDISEETTLAQVEEKKFTRLQELLTEFDSVKKLVFVEKQESADDLLVKLLREGIQSVTIHGGKEQIDRKYAIKEFSEKESGVDTLIATSVAARGLDVKGLDLVINFDPPNHMEDYVHRVGRTGRAGKEGDAYTFVTTAQERPITDLVKALRLSKYPEEQIDPNLVKIADEFLSKVKDGKEKFHFGFGGKGLSKLDEIRDSNKKMERSMFSSETPDQEKSRDSPAAAKKPVAENAKSVNGVDLPEFIVIEGKAAEATGPDKCKFHSRVTVNDLPQSARWNVVNGDRLAGISEITSTSITSKGQYYPPGSKVPTTIKQGGKEVPAPPKLYLLVEGLNEVSVRDANKLLREKIIEGLENVPKDSAPSGRYKV